MTEKIKDFIMIKGAMKSRTIWTATAVTIIGAAIELLPAVKAFIPTDTYGAILMVLGAVMAGLRTITTKPLSEK